MGNNYYVIDLWAEAWLTRRERKYYVHRNGKPYTDMVWGNSQSLEEAQDICQLLNADGRIRYATTCFC